MSVANKELSRRFTELFNTADDALAEAVLAPDVVFHGTAGDGELRGIDALKAFVAAYREAFPDACSTVEDQVAEADKVVTRWRAARVLRPIRRRPRVRDGRGHHRAVRRGPDRGGVGRPRRARAHAPARSAGRTRGGQCLTHGHSGGVTGGANARGGPREPDRRDRRDLPGRACPGRAEGPCAPAAAPRRAVRRRLLDDRRSRDAALHAAASGGDPGRHDPVLHSRTSSSTTT